MPQFDGPGVRVTTPDGWEDITDEAGEIPWLTLARAEGLPGDGALQFSAVPLEGGPDAPDAAEWLARHGRAHGLREGQDWVTEAGPPRLAAATFRPDLRVWLVCDGTRCVLVHYTTESEAFDTDELAPCESIVRGLRFEDAQEQRPGLEWGDNG